MLASGVKKREDYGQHEGVGRARVPTSPEVEAPMNVLPASQNTTPIQVETATVYRGGSRRFFTKQSALKNYAREKFRAKHRCECEEGDYASGYGGYTCHIHDIFDKVMPRYLRVLKRAIAKAEGR